MAPAQNIPPVRPFRAAWAALLTLACFLGMLTAAQATPAARIKVGFIYSGPVGDTGWNYAHERARLLLRRQCPEVESLPVQNVPPFGGIGEGGISCL